MAKKDNNDITTSKIKEWLESGEGGKLIRDTFNIDDEDLKDNDLVSKVKKTKNLTSSDELNPPKEIELKNSIIKNIDLLPSKIRQARKNRLTKLGMLPDDEEIREYLKQTLLGKGISFNFKFKDLGLKGEYVSRDSAQDEFLKNLLSDKSLFDSDVTKYSVVISFFSLKSLELKNGDRISNWFIPSESIKNKSFEEIKKIVDKNWEEYKVKNQAFKNIFLSVIFFLEDKYLYILENLSNEDFYKPVDVH